ncbi:hypothetical protein BJX64DRAFT_174109 [Aspergillus heterothallicus]
MSFCGVCNELVVRFPVTFGHLHDNPISNNAAKCKECPVAFCWNHMWMNPDGGNCKNIQRTTIGLNGTRPNHRHHLVAHWLAHCHASGRMMDVTSVQVEYDEPAPANNVAVAGRDIIDAEIAREGYFKWFIRKIIELIVKLLLVGLLYVTIQFALDQCIKMRDHILLTMPKYGRRRPE